MQLLGHLPKQGEEVRIENYLVTIANRRMRRWATSFQKVARENKQMLDSRRSLTSSGGASNPLDASLCEARQDAIAEKKACSRAGTGTTVLHYGIRTSKITLRERCTGAAHRCENDGDPSRQASPGLHHEPQQSDRRQT